MKKYDWLVLLFFVGAYLVPLGGRPLVTPDEFRYAEIPHEMIVSGDYTTPRLLGMRYFEKPAPGYWGTAAAFRIFGENAFALRLPCALAMLLAAALISFLVRQTLRDVKIAALSAILFLSCSMVYALGTFATLDAPVTGWITGVSVTAFLAALEPKFNRRKTALLIVCGIFTALAFQTKGFIAFVVPGLSVAGFLLWEKRWKEFLRLPWIPLAAALLLIAPWALAAHRADGDFWRYFTVVEHWERFTAKNSGQHPEPFWFLLPVLIGGVFPAMLAATGAFALGRERWKTLLREPLYRFSICAVALPFCFFSASSGKLPTYILPCFPFLAVIGAGAVAAYFRSGGTGRTFHVTMDCWAILLMLAGIAALAAGMAGLFPAEWKFRPLLCVMGAVALLYGAGVWYARYRTWRVRFYGFFTGLATMLLAAGWLIPPEPFGSKMPEATLRRLADELKFNPAEDILITHQGMMHAVAWTLRRSDVKLYLSTGELEYGVGRAEKENEPSARLTKAEFQKLLAKPDRPGVMFVDRDDDCEGFDFLGPAADGAPEAYVNQIRAVRLPPESGGANH